MQAKKIEKGAKFKEFMKKYLYFICLGVALIAFSVTLLITSAIQSKPVNNITPGPDPSPNPGGETKLEAVLPMTDATILKNYSATTHQYNQTLNEWAIHKAIDFKPSGDKLNVYSILDGKIVSVTTDRLNGTVITIEHEQGYKSIYKSMDGSVTLKAGDSVKKGDIIGKASTSAKNEELDGAHLHFELSKDSVIVDPALLLNLGN